MYETKSFREMTPTEQQEMRAILEETLTGLDKYPDEAIANVPVLMLRFTLEQLAERDELRAELQQLRERQSHSTAHALKMRMRERDAELAEARAEIEAWKMRLEAETAKQRELSSEVERLQSLDGYRAMGEMAAQADADRDKWKAECERLRVELSEAETGWEESRQNYKRWEQHATVIAEERDELRDATVSLEADMERLRVENSRLTGQSFRRAIDESRARNWALLWKRLAKELRPEVAFQQKAIEEMTVAMTALFKRTEAWKAAALALDGCIEVYESPDYAEYQPHYELAAVKAEDLDAAQAALEAARRLEE